MDEVGQSERLDRILGNGLTLAASVCVGCLLVGMCDSELMLHMGPVSLIGVAWCVMAYMAMGDTTDLP